MNEEEFSFEKYNVENLKEIKDVSLLKENLATSNPGQYNDKDKKTEEFMDLGDISDLMPNMNSSQPSMHDNQPLSIPYDNQPIGNSYLSLVLSPNLRELELMIRGLEYIRVIDENTHRSSYTLRKIPNHPLNEYGINQIITYLKIYTSPEIKLGRKRQKDYCNSVGHISKSIIRLIYKNLKAFGMDNQSKQRNAKVFCDAIIEIIDSAYSRSVSGKENDLSRATDFRIEGRIDSMDGISNMMNPQSKEKLKN
jgi:hypothetical protein